MAKAGRPREFMEIERKKITDLEPSPYNPRKDLQPGDPEYEKLKKSILEFGCVDPVVWNKRSERVVGGHQRIKVMQELGINEIEVSIVDLPEDKEKALNLALNKISGEWDFPKLKDLLIELDTEAWDMEMTGFDLKEMEDIFNTYGQPQGELDEGPEPQIDRAEELQKEWGTELGQIWEIGKHRLMCGDCVKDGEKLLPKEIFPLALTDPPYNVQKEGETWDSKTEKDFIDFNTDWLTQILSVTQCLIFTPGTGREMGNFPIWFSIRVPKWILIWIKSNTLTHSPIGGFQAWEPLFLYGKPQKRIPQDIYNCPITVQKDVEVAGQKLHPTPKQVKLYRMLLEDFIDKGDSVYDPFLGSGTTIVAAEQLNRICYGMEIEPKYVAVTLQRMSDMGLKPELTNGR